MTVEVVDRTGAKRQPDHVADLVEAVLDAEGTAGTVVVAFVDEEAMTGLNGHYRGLYEPTDVLSFRYADDERDWPDAPVAQHAAVRDSEVATAGLSEADLVADLGEVAVCLDIVRRYAEEEGGDPGRHLAWTLVHGVLHLVGYDHESDAGEMREREQVLLRQLDGLVSAISLLSPA